MKRRVSCSLQYLTKFKREKLSAFFAEYQRVVNSFIELYWDYDKLPGRMNASEYKKVDSWLLGKAMKCAGNQTVRIIKSTKKKNDKLVFKQYRRIFAKCKKLDRNHLGILDKNFSDWVVGRKINNKLSMPIFSGSCIDLNSDLISVQESKKSKYFDLWVRVGSVFGNHFSLIMPTRKHKQFNKFYGNDWELCSSATLRKNNDNYFIDVFFKKEKQKPKQIKSKTLGIDLGINKLLSLSDGRKIGNDIKRLINKLHRRKVGSRNFCRTLSEIKHYIGNCVNQIDIESYDLIVMENLKNITKNTRGRLNKTTRKLLGNWNIDLVYSRISDKCELSRTWLEFVCPAYTSQECSICGETHKKSRRGEVYDCVVCGSRLDADINGAINILNRFLNKEFTVPCDTKKQN